MQMLTGWLCRMGYGTSGNVRQRGPAGHARHSPWLTLLALLGALLALVPTPARADLYHYTYTGNAFTMTAQATDWPFGHPTQGRSFVLEAISAEFYTTAPLSASTTLADLTGFSMTISPWYGVPRTLTSTLDSTGCPGCPVTWVDAGFSIGAVTDLGLPGVWDFWISHDTANPTGRHDLLTLASTQSLDSVSGGYETVVSYSGGLALSPGVWAVTQVVPEPGTVMMFALGGLMVLWWSWRRRSEA